MATLLNTIEDGRAREICAAHQDQPDELLEIMHEVQAENGFLSDAALRTIASALNISRAEIHGVVSFYHDYRRKPGAGTSVKICRAEACQAVGANRLIDQAESHFSVKLDGGGTDIELQASYCLGNCALGPAVMIDDNLYGRVDLDRLKALVAKHGDEA